MIYFLQMDVCGQISMIVVHFFVVAINSNFCVYTLSFSFFFSLFLFRERKCARAVLRLSQQFPGDPGAMAPLFLNYLLIAPGESFFMAANEPHAYVAGEIIECMACSDNVVSTTMTITVVTI
jgi:mannose-6-phosphate isomerase class I